MPKRRHSVIGNASLYPKAPHPLPDGAPLPQHPISTITLEFVAGSATDPAVFVNRNIHGHRCKWYTRRYFEIRTRDDHTVISRAGSNEEVASIEWDKSGQDAMVYAEDFISLPMLVSDFVKPSDDGTYRDMVFGNIVYVWISLEMEGSKSIYLYKRRNKSPKELARIYRCVDRRTICLDISDSAIGVGLLVPCIIYTALVLSTLEIEYA
ncbi:hypothetical protein BDN70DRAFT_899905 [Pholiota conissans]|uniref:Uncharacterized protein n=1 Tax=Pholiota conissans TaxID=109636 RepID=A0A9P6CN94_9AGAR|nr:hypothetical protein BDN70DRAFT_899905 [Pholiota conissans]